MEDPVASNITSSECLVDSEGHAKLTHAMGLPHSTVSVYGFLETEACVWNNMGTV